MRHTDLYLQTDSPRYLVFAHPHRNGVLFAGGSALLWLIVNSFAEIGWGFHLFCGFGGILGLVAASRRHQLDFDLRARTYTSLRGYWGSATTSRGSFADLQGVLLVQEWDRVKTNHYKIWIVSLLFHPPKEPVTVLATKSETDARQSFEHFAEVLQVEAIDRTHEAEKTPPGQR